MALLVATALCLGAAAPGTTQIGGHTYAFPPGAFMGGVVETAAVGDMLMELAWPEMRPLTLDERAAWPRRDTIRILANSAAPVAGQAVPEAELIAHIPFSVSVATALSSGIHERSSGNIPEPKAATTDDPLEAVPGPGMVRVQTEAPLPGEVRHDVFLLEPIKRPTEFIECSRGDKNVVDPSCAQTFVVNNLVIKASYRRHLVRQWRAIHDQVAAFLTSHEVPR